MRQRPRQTSRDTSLQRKQRWQGLLLLLVLGVSMRILYEKGLLPGQHTEEQATAPEVLVAPEPRPGPVPVAQIAVPSSEMLSPVETLTAPQSVMDRVRELTDAGESAAAVALLEEAVRKDPNNTVLLMELGIILVLDLKDFERSQKIFEKVVNIDPVNRGALNELLVLYEEKGRVNEGLDFLAAHLVVDGDVSEVQYAYAKLLVKAGKQQEALDSFEAATTTIKDLQDQVYLDLAEAAISAGKPDRAVTAIEVALRIQEQELSQAKDRQAESIDFIEDRIVASKVAYARALVSVGRIGEASATLDTIVGRDDDAVVASARREVQSTRM